MSRRLSVLLISTWLIVPAIALAEDLPPEKLARIRRDEKAALERVNAAHGSKKSSEMSTAERRQVIQEQQEAIQGVMDKHGVSSKDYARQTARMGPKQNAEVDAAEKSLDSTTKKASVEEPKPLSPDEIPIQRGWSDEAPVMLEEREGAPPIVERGVPADETVPPEGEGAPPPDEAGQPVGESAPDEAR
jgi:hypothetical protein